MSTNLLILAGVPGCGKSTWSKNYFDLKYNIVSSDAIRRKVFGSLKAAHLPGVKTEANIRVFDQFHNTIATNLDHSVDTIADATSLTKSSRDRLRQIAAEHGAKCHLVLFTNVAQAISQNAARDDDTKVPPDVMVHMVNKYAQTLVDLRDESYSSILRIGGIS